MQNRNGHISEMFIPIFWINISGLVVGFFWVENLPKKK